MIKRYWSDALYLLLATGILVWVAWDAFRFRLITYSPGADYWEHTAVLHALLEDPFHPQHPLIVTTAGSPRFGPHFVLIALFARALGLDALGAMSLASVVDTWLILSGIWWFFRLYFRDRRASLYGLVVFFGSWLEAPHFSNVFKLKVFFSVAGYPSSAAMGLTFVGLALGVRLLRDPRVRPVGLGAFALLWAYVYVTHPLTATMGLPAAVLLAATEPGVPRARRLRVAGAVLGGLCLTVLWPYYPALGMVMGGTVHRMSGLEPEELGALHPFYALDALADIFGFCLPSFAMLPYLWVRRQQVFVVLGALLMLAVFLVSALLPIPLGHRYVLLSVFFLQIALVKLLLNLTPPAGSARLLTRVLGGATVALLLLYLVGSNVWTSREHFRRTAESARGRESVTVRYARKVGERAGPHAVILSTTLASWPLPTFGPKVVSPHHKNPLIPDAEERRAAASRFFAPFTPDAERRQILARYHVTHVVAPPRTAQPVQRFLDGLAEGERLAGGFTLYSLERPRAVRPVP